MMLAPLWRTLCFALVSGAILQIVTEFACWRLAPRVDAASAQASTRSMERRLLALTLGSRLLPWIVALGLLTPAYLHAEDNPYGERVSLYCVVAGTAVAFWIAFTLIRALVLSWRTQRYCSASRASGRFVAGRALMVHRGSNSLIAVMGIFQPRLLISESLLENTTVSTPALEVALEHELAHASQRDNLKLLLLALSPSFSFGSRKHEPLEARWRLAAELAADDESTGHDSERSLLLADLLVRLARQHTASRTPALATLLSAPQHLAVRVEHLLETSAPPPSSTRSVSNRNTWRMFAAVTVTAVLYLSLTFGHGAAEFLLHLGS